MEDCNSCSTHFHSRVELTFHCTFVKLDATLHQQLVGILELRLLLVVSMFKEPFGYITSIFIFYFLR
jgi:hypothetical protein